MPTLLDSINAVDPVVVATKTAKITQLLSFNAVGVQTPVIDTVYQTGVQNIRLEGTFPVDKMMLMASDPENVKLILVTINENSSKLEHALTDHIFDFSEKKIWVCMPNDIGATQVDGYIELRYGLTDRPLATFDINVVAAPV